MSPQTYYTDNKNFVQEYDKTFELLFSARLDDTIPEDMKRVLLAAQFFNATARQKILAGAMAVGATQAASDFATGLGFNVQPETVGTASLWAATLFGSAKGAKGIHSPSVPRNASNLAGGPLQNAAQISGRSKLDGGPVNETVYRADSQGNITSYAVYDSAGMIVKRGDVTGLHTRMRKVRM